MNRARSRVLVRAGILAAPVSVVRDTVGHVDDDLARTAPDVPDGAGPRLSGVIVLPPHDRALGVVDDLPPVIDQQDLGLPPVLRGSSLALRPPTLIEGKTQVAVENLS